MLAGQYNNIPRAKGTAATVNIEYINCNVFAESSIVMKYGPTRIYFLLILAFSLKVYSCILTFKSACKFHQIKVTNKLQEFLLYHIIIR